MKKLVFSIIFIFSIAISAHAEYFTPPIPKYITSTSVNVRKLPSKKSSVYTILEKGTTLDVINDQDPSGWIEIWINDNAYFIYKDFVKLYDFTEVGIGPQ